MSTNAEEPIGRIERALRRRNAEGSVAAVLADGPAPASDLFTSPWHVRGVTSSPLLSVVDGSVVAPAPHGFSEDWIARLVCAPKPDLLLVEQMRQLAATLHQAQTSDGPRSLLVTSAEASEGKSLTAVNLGLTLACSYGKKVLVLDADLRRPSLHEIAQLPNETGLRDTLEEGQGRKLPVFQVAERLTIAPAGPPHADPMTALASPRLRELLDEASQRFDWILIDSSPVGPIADATLLAAVVDAVLMVVRAGRTHYAPVQKAIDAIGRDRIVGVVLNAADQIETAGYRHYYRAYGPEAVRGSQS